MGKQSSEKGGEYERIIGRKLSLWRTRGERSDLFSRNVLSGGSFTRGGRGQPGDLLGAHPLAYDFLQLFLVEMKHWEDLQANAILWGHRGEFLKVITKVEEQARQARRHYMIVARQDRRPDLVLIPHQLGACCDLTSYHELWARRVYSCRLTEFITTDPEVFIERARSIVPLGVRRLSKR